MLSHRNAQMKFNTNQRFALRKLSVGLASVLLGLSFTALRTTQVQAASEESQAPKAEEVATDKVKADTVAPASTPVAAKPTEKPAAVNADNNAKPTVGGKTESAQEKPAQAGSTKGAVPVKKSENKQADAQQYKVHLHFVNALTGQPLAFDNFGARNGEITVNVGKNGSIYALGSAPAGYRLVDPEDLSQYFEMRDNMAYFKGAENTEVTFTLKYAPLAPVQVQYVDEGSNETLASTVLPANESSSDSDSYLRGDKAAPYTSKYKVVAIEIPGYELDDAPVKFGSYDKVQKKDDPNYNVVTFKYQKVMPDDTPLPTDPAQPGHGQVFGIDWSVIDPRDGFDVSGIRGHTYEQDNGDLEGKYQRVIDKYTKQGFTYVGNVNWHPNGDYYNWKEAAQHIDLVPNKNVTVKFVDEAGHELHASAILYGNPDNPDQTNRGLNPSQHWFSKGKWTATPAAIAGYHLAKTYGATNGEYTAFAYNVTFVYAKNEDPQPNPEPQPDPQPQPNPDPQPNPKTPDIPEKPKTDDNVPQTPGEQKPSIPEKTGTETSTEVTTTTEETPTQMNTVTSVTGQTKQSAQVTAAQPAKHASLPQTGNHDSIWAALGLMILSLFGLAASDKRRKQN